MDKFEYHRLWEEFAIRKQEELLYRKLLRSPLVTQDHISDSLTNLLRMRDIIDQLRSCNADHP